MFRIIGVGSGTLQKSEPNPDKIIPDLKHCLELQATHQLWAKSDKGQNVCDFTKEESLHNKTSSTSWSITWSRTVSSWPRWRCSSCRSRPGWDPSGSPPPNSSGTVTKTANNPGYGTFRPVLWIRIQIELDPYSNYFVNPDPYNEFGFCFKTWLTGQQSLKN